MLSTIDILVVSIIAVAGALFVAVLGWLESGDVFIARKFMSSVMRAIIAGLVFAASTYSGVDSILNGWVYVFAFIGGMGIDVAGNRLSGAIAAKKIET